MIPGLKEGQYKMSKSDPDSAIFMEDSAEDVKKKIKGAFCKPTVVEENPCLDFAKYFIFNIYGHVHIERSPERGGDIVYTSWQNLLDDYAADKVYPQDLKNAITKGLNALLDPVRRHFQENAEAKSLLATIKRYQAEAAAAKKK